MAGSSGSLHEDEAKLGPELVDRHRAIVSLMEELEAVDWYDQRVQGATDPELREILAHNRDEEKEHAAMVLEWLRRNDPKWDEELRDKLFQSGPIAHEPAGEPITSNPPGDGSLGIGSLKETK